MAEERSFDVVVIGGGGSGLAAADHGAGVVLLEKNPALGGTTAWSVGSISAARGSCRPPVLRGSAACRRHAG